MSTEIINDIIYGISNLFRIYVLFRFSQFWFQKREIPSWIEYLAYISYFILNTGCYVIFHNTQLNLLSNIIPFFLITFLYKSKMMTRTVTTVMIYAISMVWDGIIYAGAQALSIDSVIISTGIAATLMVFLTELLVERLIRYKQHQKMLAIHILTILTIPTASIVIGIFTMQPAQFESHPDMIAVECFLLLLINFMVFALYDMIGKMYKQQNMQIVLQNQNEAYSNQIEIMNMTQRQIRFLKHDMKNHLSKISSLASQHNYEGILKYVAEAEQYIEIHKSFVESGNTEIDSILNLKLNEADAIGTTIQTEVMIPTTLPISAFDVNIILGNLLDNATNALKQCKDKRLYVKIEYESGVLYIVVKNTFIAPCETAVKEGYGTGLMSVNNTVEKYNGTMKCTKQDNVFNVNIMIYPEIMQVSP
ncbi:MAG: GHKL domain-containing protein [Ruminococcus sp.]|nr:GHKL domain-containing protein [Ruminococcus sp.]